MNCEYDPDNDGKCLTCGLDEVIHYPHVKPRNCEVCGEPISLMRLDAFPKMKYCMKCSGSHSPKKVYDPEFYCAKSSLSSQNGFSKSD